MNACPENPSTGLHFQGIIDSLEKLESLVLKAGDNLTGRERLVLDRERKKLKNRVVELVREMERSFSDADNRLRRLFEAGRFSKNHDSTAPDPAAEENLVQKSRHLLQLARLGQPDEAYLKALCPDYKLLINRYFHMVQVGGFTSHEARKEVQGNLGETLELTKGRSAYQVA